MKKNLEIGDFIRGKNTRRAFKIIGFDDNLQLYKAVPVNELEHFKFGFYYINPDNALPLTVSEVLAIKLGASDEANQH